MRRLSVQFRSWAANGLGFGWRLRLCYEMGLGLFWVGFGLNFELYFELGFELSLGNEIGLFWVGF